jgi:hypothetical protein
MSDSTDYREELRQAVKKFSIGQGFAGPTAGALPPSINLYLFGPQGSGKTCFVSTCFRALYGPRFLEGRGLEGLEQSLHRSDDGTSLYSVYSLTDRICIHDTRGQREYTPEEMQQLRLVLEGRARPNTLVQQRRRYWLLLREFWRSDEQMKRTFSRNVMLNKASINTEPHFAFLVLDPNQQELLLEDADFRQCYGSLVGDFAARGVPHALLCTHGDTLTPQLRSSLLHLPQELGCGGGPKATSGPGGVLRPNGDFIAPPTAGPDSILTPLPLWGSGGPPGSSPGGPTPRTAPRPPPPAPSPFEHTAPAREPPRPQRMPDIMRIVTNYLGPNDPGLRNRRMAQPVERDREGNDVQQDIHSLLVLLDALRQADNQVMQRVAGVRPAPMPSEAESGCPIL